MSRTFSLVAPIVACLVATVSLSAAPPSFMGLGDLPGGGFDSRSRDVSADGSVVVGYSEVEDGIEAYRWTLASGMVGIGDLAGGWHLSRAWAVSDDGSVIVGGSYAGSADHDNFVEAFRWENGVMVGLGDLPGPGDPSSQAFGVSGDGSVVVGYGTVPYSNPPVSANEAFRWTASEGLVALGFLQGGSSHSGAAAVSFDGSVIVGAGQSTNGPQAYRWTVETGMQPLGDLPGGAFGSYAYGVSKTGTVVVGVSDSGQTQAFRLGGCEPMTGLGFVSLDDNGSGADGVSADGEIVVGHHSTWVEDGQNAYYENRAFVWDRLHGMRDLKATLESDYGLNLAGWILYEATAISNDDSTIVGNGQNPSGSREAFIASGLALLPCIRGDVDGNGLTNTDDLPAFIATLLDPCSATGMARCAADGNGDSDVNGLDIQRIVAVLTGN